MKKWLIIGLVIVVILVVVLVIALGGGGGGDDDDNGEVAGEVNVPVNLQGASNVGSISIELAYDSTVLEATEVAAGELAGNAMMEYNIQNPGRVIIGIIDSSGINGDGAVAVISFDVVDEEETSTLALAEVLTHDATTLVDIINETSDGGFAAEGTSIIAPAVIFGE